MKASEGSPEADMSLEALLPPDMARLGEDIGVRKAKMDAPTTLMLAILADAFIALGGMFVTTALAGTGNAPWGPVRVLAGFVFSLGLILVIVGGAELLIAALVKAAALGTQAQGLSWSAFLVRNLLPVTLGNIIGGSVLVATVYWFVYLRGGRTAGDRGA